MANKILLAAIALGLWANAVGTLVKPAHADDEYGHQIYAELRSLVVVHLDHLTLHPFRALCLLVVHLDHSNHDQLLPSRAYYKVAYMWIAEVADTDSLKTKGTGTCKSK